MSVWVPAPDAVHVRSILGLHVRPHQNDRHVKEFVIGFVKMLATTKNLS